MAKDLAWCVFFLWLLLAAFFGSQLPKYDDIFAVESTRSIITTGIPQIYWGEQEAYKYEAGKTTGWVSGLYHPPLYSYLLSAFVYLFDSLFAYRLFGVLCQFIAFWLLWLISKEISKVHVLPLAAILYFLSPLAIHQSLLFSIDTTIYPITLLLFILMFVRWEDNLPMRRTLLLGLLFGFALLSKYTTAIFLPVTVGAYYVLRRKYAFAIQRVAIIGVVGLASFLGGMLTFSSLTGLDFLYVLRFTLFSRAMAPTQVFRNMLSSGAYDIFWAPFLFFFLAFCVHRLVDYAREKTVGKGDIPLLFCSIGYLAYALKAPNIYYKFPFLMIMALYGADLGVVKYKKVLTAFLVAIPFYLVLPDPLLLLPRIIPVVFAALPSLAVLLLMLLPLFVTLFTKRYSLALGVLLAMEAGMVFAQVQGNYSTIVAYGERGYEETIAYIKPQLSPSDMVINRWDLGYLLGVSFYQDESFTHRNLCGIENTKARRKPSTCGLLDVEYRTNSTSFLSDSRVKFFIHSRYFAELDGGLTNDTKSILADQYVLDKTIGDFSIYRRKG